MEVEPPLLELDEVELEVLRRLAAQGPMVDPTEELVAPGQMTSLMATMTYEKGVVEQKGSYWRISPYGRRHVEG